MKKLDTLVQERLRILEELKQVLEKVNSENIDLYKKILTEKVLLENYKLVNRDSFASNKQKSFAEQHAIISSIASKKSEMKDYDEKLDISIVGNEIKTFDSNICLISMKEIVLPWRSTCGHVFDKSSVFDDQNKMRIETCPVLGCQKRLKKFTD
ncbi:hypothetical protein EDEG_02928 [Edhazardia aedis USNM 41457]|uniref:SP-RING-type domain-containing protein n=1 Tax=Edhazardia aedis (strain USNM 41457) TaxID=1003232 RepID=J9D4F2_EDHAE|nr:hypothetical protein EDEG_02928 [Edhazardia aedis USNM 41457]|eukprot:EJW02676.1 hypothetical protein EDEG_02928 [Edhazardia aedis USNM 41457]